MRHERFESLATDEVCNGPDPLKWLCYGGVLRPPGASHSLGDTTAVVQCSDNVFAAITGGVHYLRDDAALVFLGRFAVALLV